MIDVVFQQLIYFMLTSGFILHPGIRVTLPKAPTSQRIAASNLVITLTREHVIYWNDEAVTLKELRERLSRAEGHKAVLIRADRHAYVDKLIELWDLCRDSGHHEVHIGTLSE
jgi:biopolymer transport protein ExbD